MMQLIRFPDEVALQVRPVNADETRKGKIGDGGKKRQEEKRGEEKESIS